MKTRDEIKKAIQEADKREEKTIKEIILFFWVLITIPFAILFICEIRDLIEIFKS